MGTASFSQMTLLLPRESKMPVPAGQWRRVRDGRIMVTYTLAQWMVARLVYDAIAGPEIKQGRLGV